MGIKELWSLLGPFSERRPIHILQGEVVAIDLAGWVCESLNVVDYFIHPRHYMKNLFFRTCYMLLEGIIPVFVLDGKAPELKAKTIKQRNELQFRGVKPVEKSTVKIQLENNKNEFKGRTRFNHVLKNCELLLNCMGISCVQAPGEAEAYCAFLNKNGFVDGVVSQDSDCFAYGAIKVYRNFAVSTQGSSSSQGGSVDLYDMDIVCQNMDFGQEKIIVLALFCGCDYINGITGAGKDSVLKLFKKYKNSEILDKIKSWRLNDSKYSELEMKVNDKNICSNCGHIGKTISHSKSGCSICRLSKGCLETSWKEQKLIVKAELLLRQKALQDPNFPSQQIINEFLSQPDMPPNLNLSWNKPDIVKFVRNIGKLLQWEELYCFQKILPILTRWQLKNLKESEISKNEIISPELIVRRRVRKGNPSYEIVWKDDKKLFEGLISGKQIETYCIENRKEVKDLWTTIEPADLFGKAYSTMTNSFLKSKEKPKKNKVTKSKTRKKEAPNNSLDMSSLVEAVEKLTPNIKKKPRKGLQLIDKFFYKTDNTPQKIFKNIQNVSCSTPKKKISLLDLENESSYNDEDLSNIINDIVNTKAHNLSKFNQNVLIYEHGSMKSTLNRSKDDLDLLPSKRKRANNSFNKSLTKKDTTHSASFDDLSLLEDYNKYIPKTPRTKNKELSFFFEKVDFDIENDEFAKSVVIILSDSD